MKVEEVQPTLVKHEGPRATEIEVVMRHYSLYLDRANPGDVSHSLI